MIVVLSISNSKLKFDKWNVLLDRWAKKQSFAFYEPPQLAQLENDEATGHLLGEGSIRGVLIQYTPQKIEFRLDQLSSQKDWLMAFNFVKIALQAGGGKFDAGSLVEFEGGFTEKDLNKEKGCRTGIRKGLGEEENPNEIWLDTDKRKRRNHS